MAFKSVTVDGLDVTIYKRRGARSLRISLRPDGQVRVTIPSWAAYQAGVAFVKSREQWIREQQVPTEKLRHGQASGKAHHLEFILRQDIQKPSARLKDTAILVSYPAAMSPYDQAVQTVATAAAKRALRQQAASLLPQRLKKLAAQYGFQYAGVSARELKSRWGSCDQQQHITLNIFLMQLPWDYIDYVLLHELTHTEQLNHGPEFWHRLGQCLPNYLEYKQQLRKHKPVVIAGALS